MASDDIGKKETEQMFALIGRAITRWSFVEERLCSIFLVCTSDVASDPGGGLNFMDSTVGNHVFYSVENFRGKLNLVDTSLNAYVPKSDEWAISLRSDWARLRDKTRKLSLRRNKLAHFTVLPGYEFDEGIVEPRLVPPYGSPAYYAETGIWPGKLTFSKTQIGHLEHAFFILEEKLCAFAFRLARQEELFDIYAQRLVRRIETHSHRDQIRAERLKLALSSLE